MGARAVRSRVDQHCHRRRQLPGSRGGRPPARRRGRPHRHGCRRLVSTSCWLSSTSSPPTSSSPTFGCRRRAPTRAFAPRPGSATVTRPRESSCSASSLLRRTPWRSSKPDRIAAAYLLKDRVADADDLVDAVRAVAAGGSVIDAKVVEQLVAARSQSSSSPVERLTPREREILGEMAQGKSNAAIAATLFSANGRSRSTSTRSSPSSISPRSRTSIGASRRCSCTSRRREASNTPDWRSGTIARCPAPWDT